MLRTLVFVVTLLLSGCTSLSYWVTDMPDYRPRRIEIVEVADLNVICRQSSAAWNGNACVYRSPEVAHVYVRPALTREAYECVMRHEIIKHVIEGKNHDNRPVFTPDCGD